MYIGMLTELLFPAFLWNTLAWEVNFSSQFATLTPATFLCTPEAAVQYVWLQSDFLKHQGNVP